MNRIYGFVIELIRKFRYSFLALLNVGFQFLNSMINIRVLGVSYIADVYFISNMIFAALCLLSLLYLEQFWIFYSREKIIDKSNAVQFYNTVITRGTVIQIVFSALVIVFVNHIILFFARDIDPVRKNLLIPVMYVQMLTFILYPATTINSTMLNAELKFGRSYLFQLFPILANFIVLLYMLISGSKDILLLAAANLAGNIGMLVLQFISLSRHDIRFRLRWNHKVFLPFLKSSIKMRFAQNMNNFLQQPIISNILTSLSEGYVSSYNYAKRFNEILYSIVIGPSFNMLRAVINDNFPINKKHEIMAGFRSFYKMSLVVIPLMVLFFIVLEWFLNIVSGGGISMEKINLIKSIYLLISIWLIQIIAEQPFVLLIIAADRSFFFLIQNVIYIALLFITSIVTFPAIGVYSIPVAMITAQLSNNIMNFFMGIRVLKGLTPKEHAL